MDREQIEKEKRNLQKRIEELDQMLKLPELSLSDILSGKYPIRRITKEVYGGPHNGGFPDFVLGDIEVDGYYISSKTKEAYLLLDKRMLL